MRKRTIGSDERTPAQCWWAARLLHGWWDVPQRVIGRILGGPVDLEVPGCPDGPAEYRPGLGYCWTLVDVLEDFDFILGIQELVRRVPDLDPDTPCDDSTYDLVMALGHQRFFDWIADLKRSGWRDPYSLVATVDGLLRLERALWPDDIARRFRHDSRVVGRFAGRREAKQHRGS